MATLTIKVGSLTASVTATDTSATKALANYAAAYDLDMPTQEYDAEGNPLPTTPLTAQERLDAVLQHLVGHINTVSVGQQRRAQRQAADEAVDGAKEVLK